MHTINYWLVSSVRYIRARFHDIYFLRKITFWVFLIWILFTILLSIQSLSPNLDLHVLWIIFISTTLLSVCLWQASTQEIPKAGLVILGILVLFICLSYIVVTKLGGNGLEYITLGIVVLIAL